MYHAALLLLALALSAQAAAPEDTTLLSEEPLGVDDECEVLRDHDDEPRLPSSCALNALQRSGRKGSSLLKQGQREGEAEPEPEAKAEAADPLATAVDQTSAAFEAQVALAPSRSADPDVPQITIAGWGSCAIYGCVGYVHWHGCQCNSGCYSHGNCCYDYEYRCKAKPHPQPHPPAPKPHPPAPEPASCTASWSHNCIHTRSCCETGMTCFEKNSGWAACLRTCSVGVHWEEPPQHRTPWNCRKLSSAPAPAPPVAQCSESYTANCLYTQKCCERSHTCYAKNQYWASCMPHCSPGIHWNDPPDQRIPWSCQVLDGGVTPKVPTSAPTPPPPTNPPTPAPTLPPGFNYTSYELDHPQHALPSSAPLYTFYLYRTQNDENYDPINQNLANLAGTLWYLHNEIVWHIPRRFDKTRIQRFKVQTRATQALFDKGMNFGVRVAFDKGQCTGPYWQGGHEKTCKKDWDTYGYTVGCNHVEKFPTWFKKVHYRNAVWYSMPGPCPDRQFHNHTPACEEATPGGMCPEGVTPTGQGDCTFSFESAGEISLDSLDGIGSYWDFIQAGGKEYDQHLDRGIGNDFWDFKYSDMACQLRMEAVKKKFREKLGETEAEDLEDPPCDFNQHRYYS